MIALFNNTQMSWRVKTNAQKSNHTEISVSKKNKNGDVTTLKLSVPAGIDLDAVVKSGTTDIYNIYDKTTNISYDNKTHRPNISETGDNKDIFLLGIDIENSIITDMTRQDLFVIGFIIARNSLFMIASVKAGCEAFHITTYNKENKVETTYNFAIGTNTEVNLADRTTVEITHVDKAGYVEPFKIRTFRPSRSTHLLFVKNTDKELAEKVAAEGKIFAMDKNEIVYFEDGDQLSDFIKTYLNYGYSAATILTSLDNIKGEQFGDYEHYIFLMRSVFNVNNIILGGLTPPAVIKR